MSESDNDPDYITETSETSSNGDCSESNRKLHPAKKAVSDMKRISPKALRNLRLELEGKKKVIDSTKGKKRKSTETIVTAPKRKKTSEKAVKKKNTETLKSTDTIRLALERKNTRMTAVTKKNRETLKCADTHELALKRKRTSGTAVKKKNTQTLKKSKTVKDIQRKPANKKKTDTVKVTHKAKAVKANVLPDLLPWNKNRPNHRPRKIQRSDYTHKRPRVMCHECPLEVVNFPRHLRDAHDYSRDLSISVAKKLKYKVRDKKPKRKRTICPVQGCGSRVLWLGQHLKEIHKMGTAQKKFYMSKADKEETCSSEETEYPDDSSCNIDSNDVSICTESTSEVTSLVVEPRESIDEEPITEENEKGRSTPDEAVDSLLDNQATHDDQPVEEPVPNPFYSVDRHPLLIRFFSFLTSYEKGKNEKNAKQHVIQVFNIWSSIDERLKLSSLVDANLVRDEWLAKSNLTPGTKKSYISSLREFYNFIRFSDDIVIPENKISIMMIKTSNWNFVLSKEQRLRRAEIQAEDSDTVITPEEIKAFLDSRWVAEVMEYFKMARQGDTISKRQHLAMRNYLMFMILLHNGQRSGAVMNLRLRAYRFAMERDDSFIMTVAQHKTAMQGAATLCIPNKIMDLLRVYVRFVRPNHPGITNDHLKDDSTVFLTYGDDNGSPMKMTQSGINSSLKSIWMTVHADKTISATKLRKATTTFVREKHPEERESLALHMTHRPSTADQYYWLAQKKANAVKITNIIAKVMTAVTTPIKKQDDNTREQDQKTTNEQGTRASKGTLIGEHIIKAQEQDTVESENTSIDENTIEAEEQEGRASENTCLEENTEEAQEQNVRASENTWTEDDTIEAQIQDPGASKKTLIEEHILKAQTQDTASQDIFIEEHIEETKEQSTTETEEPIMKVQLEPEEPNVQKIIPQSSRRAFSPEDSIKICDLCRDLITNKLMPITAVTVSDQLSTTKEGRELIRKYTNIYGSGAAKKLADRVRSKRRLLKKKY